jgi:hypothetical protein
MVALVARSPARHMMSALARNSNEEDHLTELFACVLDADVDLRGALLDRLGVGDRTVRRVQTQVATGVALRTMDMHFSLAVGGVPGGEVWFEHKLKNDFNPGQLDRYEEALAVHRSAVMACALAVARAHRRQASHPKPQTARHRLHRQGRPHPRVLSSPSPVLA